MRLLRHLRNAVEVFAVHGPSPAANDFSLRPPTPLTEENKTFIECGVAAVQNVMGNYII